MYTKVKATASAARAEAAVSWIPQLTDAGILEPIENYMSKSDPNLYVASPINDATLDSQGVRDAFDFYAWTTNNDYARIFFKQMPFARENPGKDARW